MDARTITPEITPQRLADLRAMLIEQRTFRVDQLAQLHDQHGPLACRVPGISDELEVAARAALRDVLAALRRMDAGTYGVCTGCGEPVGAQRLEILPQAALCTSCHRVRRPSRH